MSNGDKQKAAVEAEIVNDADSEALATISRAETDVQIATAKRYPRSVVTFKRQALELATLDEETAESMFYSLERRDREGNLVKIQGPSVRLAEVALSCWGNCHAGARPVAREETVVRVQGVCWDLERNVRVSMEVSRRIAGKRGRYSEDMITVTENAAAAIALRNAILRVIPRALVDPIFEEARKASVGKGLTMEQRRVRIKEQFAEMGAKESHVLMLVHRKGWDDVSVDDIVHLKGLRTAILEGHVTLEAALSESSDSAPTVIAPATLSADAIRKAASVVAENDAKPPSRQAPVPVKAVEAIPEPEKPKEREPGDDMPEDKEIAELFGE